ncbi:hypothetical protein DXN05_04110 [Deminuibacter soli]|uniref:Uncharacterized protein n=2 Tax=Deminuibacter soli TaxID=2291815 RepID=A0A3E1NQG6_9BACT|nr:hypothetical protein DXN05_04110 [Deminuibacter soli]
MDAQSANVKLQHHNQHKKVFGVSGKNNVRKVSYTVQMDFSAFRINVLSICTNWYVNCTVRTNQNHVHMKRKWKLKEKWTRAVVRLTGSRAKKSKVMKDGFEIIQEVDAIEDAAYYFPKS